MKSGKDWFELRMRADQAQWLTIDLVCIQNILTCSIIQDCCIDLNELLSSHEYPIIGLSFDCNLKGFTNIQAEFIETWLVLLDGTFSCKNMDACETKLGPV